MCICFVLFRILQHCSVFSANKNNIKEKQCELNGTLLFLMFVRWGQIATPNKCSLQFVLMFALNTDIIRSLGNFEIEAKTNCHFVPEMCQLSIVHDYLSTYFKLPSNPCESSEQLAAQARWRRAKEQPNYIINVMIKCPFNKIIGWNFAPLLWRMRIKVEQINKFDLCNR